MKRQFACVFTAFLCLTVHAQAQQWSVQYTPTPTGTWVTSLDFLSVSAGLAVGSGGVSGSYLVYTYVNGTWTQQTLPGTNYGGGSDLKAVKYSDHTTPTAWAVGTHGVIFKHQSGVWSMHQAPNAVYGPVLYSLYFTDANNGWAVGYGSAYGAGVIIKFSNGVWDIPNGSWQNWYSYHPTYVPSSIPNVLNSVDFADANNGWAVGDGGIMMKLIGSAWVQQPTVTTHNLRKVRFLNATTGFAVGDAGTVLKYLPGTQTWSLQSPIAAIGTANLFSVDFEDANNAWAVSVNGTLNGGIYKYSNGNWSAQTNPVILWTSQPAPLQDVHFVNANHGWASGNQAIIWLNNPPGVLKVCKVGGPGVVGTLSTFHAGSGPAFTVRAGAGPGGTCSIGPSFDIGTNVTVTESLPANITVTGITVAPPARLAGTPNLAGGSVDVTIGSGITEVTFTNRKPTGFLEICKRMSPVLVPGGGGTYSFTVNPGNLGPFEILAGSCSPAIEVAAGLVQIKEAASSHSSLLNCSTIPAANQGPCDITARTSRVTVAQGDVSTQTIAILTNRPGPLGTGTGYGILRKSKRH